LRRTTTRFCPLQSLCVGEMSQVPESGSCKEASAGPDIQSNRAPTRAADEMRLGLRRPTHRAQHARTLHDMREAAPQVPTKRTAERGTRKPSADAHRGGEYSAVGAAAPDSRLTEYPRIHATGIQRRAVNLNTCACLLVQTFTFRIWGRWAEGAASDVRE
jgi:hypothetical protein